MSRILVWNVLDLSAALAHAERPHARASRAARVRRLSKVRTSSAESMVGGGRQEGGWAEDEARDFIE